MNGLVIGLMVLVIPGYCRGQPLDKTGTTGSRTEVGDQQTPRKQEPDEAGSFVAERAGFEPADRCYPVTALAKRRYRPLSHLSRPLTS